MEWIQHRGSTAQPRRFQGTRLRDVIIEEIYNFKQAVGEPGRRATVVEWL
jgi:hypothetical protein